MKNSNENTTALVLELDEAALATVHGGADEYVDWTSREPYLDLRRDALAGQDQAWDRAWAGATEIKPSEVVLAARDWAQAKELQQFAEQNLNHISRREDALRQAREADQREYDAERQRELEEEEDNRLIEEAEEMLRETNGAGGGGGGGGTPIGQDPYMGESPSFPSNLINAPPSHEPQISTEQIGPTTIGGSGYQDSGSGRLY